MRPIKTRVRYLGPAAPILRGEISRRHRQGVFHRPPPADHQRWSMWYTRWPPVLPLLSSLAVTFGDHFSVRCPNRSETPVSTIPMQKNPTSKAQNLASRHCRRFSIVFQQHLRTPNSLIPVQLVSCQVRIYFRFDLLYFNVPIPPTTTQHRSKLYTFLHFLGNFLRKQSKLENHRLWALDWGHVALDNRDLRLTKLGRVGDVDKSRRLRYMCLVLATVINLLVYTAII